MLKFVDGEYIEIEKSEFEAIEEINEESALPTMAERIEAVEEALLELAGVNL